MTNKMEQSPLWLRVFAQSNEDVNRLTSSLRDARTRVGHLTSRITASLPSLTMHDLTHLDGLWTVAGTIAGDDFVLTPLEGYLFGTAVLLHDAALCFEAYSGGQHGVRNTVQWRDAYARRRNSQEKVDKDAVDFEALRSLHAAQAARLATEPWETEDGPIYIIHRSRVENPVWPNHWRNCFVSSLEHRPCCGTILNSETTSRISAPGLGSESPPSRVPVESC